MLFKDQSLRCRFLTFRSVPFLPLNTAHTVSLRMLIAMTSLMVSAFCGMLSAQPAPQVGDRPSDTVAAQDVIGYLNQTIDWYRRLAAEEQAATDSNDALFLGENKQLANQIMRLSFDFAKAQAQLLSAQGHSAANVDESAASARFQSLSQAAAKAEARAHDTQVELEGLKQQLQSAPRAKRLSLQSAVDEVQSELDLAQARSETLRSILQFATTAGNSGKGSLLAQIEELQRALPEVSGTAPSTPSAGQVNAPAAPGAASTASLSRHVEPNGLLDLFFDLFALTRKMRVLDDAGSLTDSLTESSKKLRSPLVKRISDDAKRGDDLVNEPDSTDPVALDQQRREFVALTARFKQASAVAVPLGKQSILLDLYRNNLSRSRSTVKSQYMVEGKNLLLRLGVLGFVLAVVFALSEIWRRATFRYVKDLRRRYQFLLLRRIVLWFVVITIVIFAFATEIGSLATFAGLITAGVAVALQNPILSVLGYFFLIGKYGVRVGDRVQISGITGDVVDIGLVRLHLMEVAGGGSERQPTGRVVAFSNAVVFQPTGSFFKQIPGTNFVWHDVCLMLAPDSDYKLAEQRMLGAVEAVYAGYREKIEAQHLQMERILNVVVDVPKPQSRLRLTQTGLEVVIRYPLELGSAAQVDDQVTRELLNALEQAPKLKLVGTGTPNIQPVGDKAPETLQHRI